jgi:hypothetical protein
MINKKIFVALLSTVCFLQSAEHGNYKAIARRQTEAIWMMGALIAVTLDRIIKENERLQVELEKDRARIVALNNQKNRHSQKVSQQKYAQTNIKKHTQHNKYVQQPKPKHRRRG